MRLRNFLNKVADILLSNVKLCDLLLLFILGILICSPISLVYGEQLKEVTFREFAISIPSNWYEIPKNYLNNSIDNVQKAYPQLSSKRVSFECAYQREEINEGIKQPGVTISVDKDRELAKSLLRDMRNLTRVKMMLTFNQALRQKFINPILREFVINKDKNMIRYIFEVKNDVVQFVTFESMYITDDAVFHVICSANPKSFSADSTLFVRIFDTFRLK